MDIKNSTSTDLRPEGARLIDAPFVNMDIPRFIRQLKTEITWQTSHRNAMTIFKAKEFCVVLIALHKDAILKKHETHGIITIQVIEGEIDFCTDHVSSLVGKGKMIAIHAGLNYSLKAIKESVFILTLTIVPHTTDSLKNN